MENNTFLGSGFKFPLQVNPATGRIVMVDGIQSVRESVYMILMTQKGERFTRENFGSKLLSYTFMDTSITRMNIMANEIEQTLLEQEPRISNVEVTIKPELDRGCLIVDIRYTITQNYTEDSLVFPFYLNAEGELQ
ncbi:MAG: GPW/gp25 family protein [Lachnospiraceae bacterium]|jgi:Phage baseplate assembly protein W